MNIVLIGFSGSGKTTVSKALSKKLKMKCFEMDDLVVAKSKRKSVNEIFQKDGETHFRELEIQVAKELAKQDNCIISTGGGVVVNKIILDYFKEKGIVVHLRTSFSEARRRLENTNDRPLQREVRKARKIYNFRKALYRQYADAYVRTDNKTVEEVRDEIIDMTNDER